MSDRITLFSDYNFDFDRLKGESLTENKILDNIKPKSILRYKPIISILLVNIKIITPVPISILN